VFTIGLQHNVNSMSVNLVNNSYQEINTLAKLKVKLW